MSVTERMAAIHIDPAASNNRGDGATAGTAWRDAEELSRRLGRGSAVFRQPTTITYHGSTPSGDAAHFDNLLVGNGGIVTIQGVATVVASGTLTSFSAFNRTPGAEALNIVGASGLSGGFGAHAGRYLRITGGARAGNGMWIHESFGATASVSTPGNFTFPLATSFARVTPANGDPFEIVTYPMVHCGDWNVGTTYNQKPFAGGGFNQINVQDMELDFGGQVGGLQHDNGSALRTTVTGSIFRRCSVWTPTIFAGSGFAQFYQCNFRGNVDVLSGLLVRFVACRFKDNTASLAVRGGCNAVLDFDSLFDGAAIFVIDNGSLVVGTACMFNRGADRSVLIDPGCQVWVTGVSLETPTLWGTNNADHGVTVKSGGKLVVDAGGSVTVNKTLGPGRELLVGDQDVLYSQVNGSVSNNGATVAFL